MTLAAGTRVQYNGDGATVSFAISFVTWDEDDTEVILTDSSGVETVWVRGTQYTISLTSPPATSTLTVITSPTDYTPASGETLTITSDLANTQTSSLPTGGALPSDTLEQMVDKAIRQIQQVVGAFDRAIQQGSDTPEGAITANVGTLFLRTNGGASTTLYVKESGTGNSGWVAK